MILIRQNITEYYSRYGFDHFLFCYGENEDINHVKDPDIEIGYDSYMKRLLLSLMAGTSFLR